MKRRASGIGAFACGAFMLCVLLLLSVAGLSIWSHLRAEEDYQWVTHTYAVKQQISDSVAILDDMVISGRSFLLAGRAEYLQAYESARDRIDASLDVLREMTADNPTQGPRIELLRGQSHERSAVLQRAIAARRTGDFLGGLRIIVAFEWSRVIGQTREIITAMNGEENRLLKEREGLVASSARLTTATMGAGVVLIIVSGCAAIVRINRDSRARKQAEETSRSAHAQLAEQAEVLESVLRSVGDGVAVADANGKFVVWNPAATRITGQGPADVPPERWSEIYGVYLTDRVTPCPVDRVPLVRAMHGDCVDGEILFLRGEKLPQGRWVSVTARPLTTPQGHIRGGTVVFSDITQRMKTQQALQSARDELESRVQERTSDLARSNQQLEQFAYVASHDLQQPLRMVTSYVQLLAEHLKDTLDADSKEFMGYVVDGTGRMKRLINDLLIYSRIGSQGKPFAPADCEQLFAEAMKVLDAAIRESGARVTHDPLPTVLGDDTHLVQLFQNLIDNAVKYHADKPPRIHVGAVRNGKDWVFSVRDNGIGIDPQYADRIFLVFQRLHGKGQFSGTGIGLAICKKVVEGHRGKIWVESHPGEGSTFYFSLPFVEIQNDDAVRIRETDRALVGGGRPG